jgi:hypothetical protein
MPRITKRKVKPSKKSVPTIRKAFDAFHSFLAAPRSEAEIQKKFKELFGKRMSKEHLAHVLSMKIPQRGGMAPLDYVMESPDKALSALPYVDRGFGFANMNSLTEPNPKEYLGSTQQVGPQMGPQMGGRKGKRNTVKGKRNGQKGGGIADMFASIPTQYFSASAPPSIMQAAARLNTGQIGLPSSLPEINPMSIRPQTFIQGAKLV